MEVLLLIATPFIIWIGGNIVRGIYGSYFSSDKLPSKYFVLAGLGVFGLLFFLGAIFVGFIHILIPASGILVPLGLLIFFIICTLDSIDETKEKMAKWKEENPYNYEYYEKKDKDKKG